MEITLAPEKWMLPTAPAADGQPLFSQNLNRAEAELAEKILRTAADEWFDDPDFEARFLHPFVQAFAAGTARFWQNSLAELDRSDTRVLDRWLETTLPEVHSGADPAHGLLRARPATGLSVFVGPDSQFQTTGERGQRIFFSPLRPFLLFDVELRCLAQGRSIFEIGSDGERREIAQAGFGSTMAAGEIWLGLDGAGAAVADRLTFYLGFPATAGDSAAVADFTRNLQWIKWLDAAGNVLDVRSGFQKSALAADPAVQDLEQKMAAFYQKNIFEISLPHSPAVADSPEILKNIFSQMPTGVARWVRLIFPPEIPAAVLTRLEVAVNCFPVANLQWVEKSTPEAALEIKMEQDGQHFFAVGEVQQGSKKLRPLSFFDKKISGSDKTYHLRRGICKADRTRDLEEESVVICFDALPSEEPFVVNYWLTDAAGANGLDSQASVRQYNSAALRSAGLAFVSTTCGGAPPAGLERKVAGFRHALLSRGRLVTAEDFRQFVLANWGDSVSSVEIKHGIVSDARFGLARSLEVLVKMKTRCEPPAAVQVVALENEMFERSTGLFPIRIKF